MLTFFIDMICDKEEETYCEKGSVFRKGSDNMPLRSAYRIDKPYAIGYNSIDCKEISGMTIYSIE